MFGMVGAKYALVAVEALPFISAYKRFKAVRRNGSAETLDNLL